MFIRYCLACSLFIFSSFIQANSSLVNTIIKANYAEHYCAIGSKMSAIDQAIESQQTMSNELAWLSIGKAAYLEYCLGESYEQKALLTSVTQSSDENISSEAKSTAYTHLGDFLIEHEGRQEDACHLFYLAKGDNFQGLTYYTRHRIELMSLLYCDNQDPIDMYKKLLDKKAETEKIGDDFLSRKVLDTLYYFFIQNDEMYLATNASKELLQKYKHTFSNSELALAYYLLSIDSLLIGNFDDSKKYGDEFATLVSRHKLSNYEYLINVVYLQYYFSTQAYEKAYRYAQRLAPMLSTIQQFNETGKINIIYASVCFELNNRECVDGFINNLSTLTTKQDQDSLLLRALLLKVEAEKQGNMALLASIKTLESNWQKKLYDKQDSSLLVQINELAQASIKTQHTAQSVKASKLDVEQDVLLILLTLCGVITISTLWFLHRRQQKNALDPVTKVLSRKAGFLQFQSQGKPIEGKTHAFILFSLDNYESIKDQYGYQQADAVLKQLVIIAKKAVRRGDLIARVGNETFGIMLINSTKAIAYKVESKLTDKVNSASFFIDKNTSVKGSLLTGTSFNSDGDNGFITSFKQADETMQALAINKPELATH